MRLAPFMIILFVVWIVLGLLNATMDPTLSNYQQYSTGSTYLDILIHPWMWSTNSWLDVLLGGVAIVVGVFTAQVLFGRSDIITLSGLAAVFLSMGALPIVELYSFMTRNTAQFMGCVPNVACTPSIIAGVLTAGVVGLLYSMTVLEWWLWRPATQ